MADITAFQNVVDGDKLFEDYFNGVPRIRGSIYTGSGFDSTRSGSVGTTTNNHTIAISAANLIGCTYILVFTNTFVSSSAAGADSSGTATLLIERNETGQSSWSDVLAVTNMSTSSSGAGYGSVSSGASCMVLPITLTAGELTNGIDIKLTTAAIISDGAGESAAITNLSTYFVGHG